MKINPKTDEQLAMEGLFPDGVYPAEILEVEERDDSKGRPFFMLKLGVYNDNQETHVYDNVSDNWMAFKLKHLYESAGKLAVYESGNLDPSDMLHWQLTVVLMSEGSREYTSKDGEKKTAPPKNVVKDYVTSDALPEKMAAFRAKLDAESDLPVPESPALPSDLPWEK